MRKPKPEEELISKGKVPSKPILKKLVQVFKFTTSNSDEERVYQVSATFTS